MSKATKKKHVQKELLSRDFCVPEDLNRIVKITQNSGNNLHQIETHSGETYFVSMPGKFRNNIWIKPGDFVIVKPIEEGNKVKAEIHEILNKQYIHFLKAQNSWPFTDNSKQDSPLSERMSPDGDSDKDSDSDLLNGNLNRRNQQVIESSSSEED